MKKLTFTAATLASLILSTQSYADSLPLSLAREAANEALSVCEKQGHRVTVVFVNSEGLVQVALRGDGSTPHTIDSAKGKAYTAVTLGPIRNMTLTSEIAAASVSDPKSAQLAHIPGVLLLAGGALVRSGGAVVGAIGVGGANGGNLDEACALAGIAKIKERLL